MDSNSLDKYIKDKLINLDGGEPLDSWQHLSEKIDASEALISPEDLAFDIKVKDAVENISAIEMPAWESFLPNLELEENLDDIQADIALDNVVKENLHNLEVPYDKATWALLAHKIDVSDDAEVENSSGDIDRIAYDKLLNYTVPQRAGDWESFSKELDKEFILPLRLLFKYKLAEIIILSSLILIFIQVKPLLLDRHDDHRASQEVENPTQAFSSAVQNSIAQRNLALPTETKMTPTISEEQVLHPNKYIEQEHVHKHSTPSVKKLAVKRNLDAPVVKKNSVNADVFPSSDQNKDTELHESNTSAGNKLSDPILPASEANNNINSNGNTASQKLAITKDKEVLTNPATQNIPRLANVALSNLMLDSHNSSLPVDLIDGGLSNAMKWRIGIHLDAEYTYIMTSYDKIFDLNSYNHAAIGYGAGLSTSILLGNWEIASGFTYSTRQYTPKANPEILGNLSLGYLKIELDKIQMNLLSVPLHLRYHFKNEYAKTHFYMLGGATMHVATQANYFIKSDFINNSRRPTLTDTKTLVETSDTSSDKIYSLGWFEGGSYIENRYFTLSFGFGFERKISSRYSVFGQTTYSQYMDKNGIGPNRDRFNSVGISTGVRALFK